ncbi:MAG TPA: hypothetical protein VHT91_40910 [Kofleriaceae bacterium]|jgi:hypothetical protein|nr:hypothetical protein [Kofleriaceae bacterium]
MLAKNTTIVGVVLGMLFAARAHAQPDPDSETKPLNAAAAAAGGEGGEQLTLQKGRLVVNAYLAIGLSDGAAFKPISLSPDLWYGVTDDITAGVVHSAVGTTGFMGGAGLSGLGGQSLCLTGSDNGCTDLYSNVAVEGRYRLNMSNLAVAVEGGVVFQHVTSPMELGIKLGAVGRWRQGQITVESSPNLFIAITDRSVNGVTVNHDVLNLPATLLYTLNPTITLAAQTGLALPLEDAGDAYAVPLSIGVFYKVNDQLDVTAAFSLPRLIASGSPSGIDARSLTLGGTYAF